MKTLWLSLLALMTSSQTPGAASPLRTPDRPADHWAGPSDRVGPSDRAGPSDRVGPSDRAGPSEAERQLAQDYLQHFYGSRPGSDRPGSDRPGSDRPGSDRPGSDRPGSDRPRRAAEKERRTALCEDVQKMQRFFGLPPTGELTRDTLAVMRRPRCGLSDVEPFGETIRWKKSSLSYRISGSNLPVPSSKVRRAFRAAWKLWSNVAPMNFRRRKRREADIVISFHNGDHEDGSPFDGSGGILAHAFLPGFGIGGDVHFDADEEWSFNSTGFNLFSVAVHEFGHALGLPHSSDPGAVMYPAYNFAPNDELQLSLRDVKDVQQLYGISPKFASLFSKNPPPRTPDRCDPDLSFDAVSELGQEVLFFKDRFMWRKHPQFDETGLTLISSLWPDSVPPHLDAAYENVERRVSVFFKGHQYWELRQLKLQDGFPRNISDLGFPSRITSVDAALHFRNERYTVFFTGHECWRYDEVQQMMEGSPTLIEQQWPEVPAPIDAAVHYDGLVHFFRGNVHLSFDSRSGHVVSSSPVNQLLDCRKDDSETERR